jgi:CRISPR-associated protein Cmr1
MTVEVGRAGKDYAVEYAIIQEELLKNQKVISLEVELAYPRIGGYKATPCSIDLNMCESPRATEVKGLWRWWMRVALATYLGSYPDAGKKVSELLGGGEDKHSQSLFTVVVRLSDEERKKLLDAVENAKKIYNVLDALTNKIIGVAQLIKNELKNRLKEVAKDICLELEFKPQPPLEPLLIKIEIRGSTRSRSDIGTELKDALIKAGVISSADEYSKVCDRLSKGKGYTCRLTCEIVKRLLSDIGTDVTAIYRKLVDELSLAEVPRYRLLLMKRKDEESSLPLCSNIDQQKLEGFRKYLKRVSEELALPDRVKVVINVYRNGNVDSARLRFAIATLLLALVFGGLGGITRRGFGSVLRVNVIDYCNDVKSEVELVKEIFSARDKEELMQGIQKLVNHCKELAKRVLNINTERTLQEAPLVPVLIENYFRFNVIECNCEDELKLLEIIENSCLKQTWKRRCGEDKARGGSYHTWILGLPRGQVKGNKMASGYGIEQNGKVVPERRASAIHLKMISAGNKMYVLVYGFLTRDWLTKRIVHIAAHRNEMKGKGRGKSKEEEEKEVRDVTELYVKVEKDCDKKCDLLRPQQGSKFVEQVFNAAFNFVSCIVKENCSIGDKCGGRKHE